MMALFAGFAARIWFRRMSICWRTSREMITIKESHFVYGDAPPAVVWQNIQKEALLMGMIKRGDIHHMNSDYITKYCF